MIRNLDRPFPTAMQTSLPLIFETHWPTRALMKPQPSFSGGPEKKAFLS